MSAKEGGEASAGLLYLKVLHRKFTCADMRKPATTDRLGRGYDYKVNNSKKVTLNHHPTLHFCVDVLLQSYLKEHCHPLP